MVLGNTVRTTAALTLSSITAMNLARPRLRPGATKPGPI